MEPDACHASLSQFNWDPALLDAQFDHLLAAMPPDRAPDELALLDAPFDHHFAAMPMLHDRATDAPSLLAAPFDHHLAAMPMLHDRAPGAPSLLAAPFDHPPPPDRAPGAPALLAAMQPPPPPQQQQEDAAAGGRRLWGYDESRFLLQQAGCTMDLVDRLEEKEEYVPIWYLWTEISRKMDAQGYHRNRDECRSKYRSLLRYYKNHRRGKAPVNAKSYFQLDALLEPHVRRQEAKAKAKAEAAEEASSSSAAAAAKARVRARAVERRRRRALSGQGGAGAAPAVQGGADGLMRLITPELDKREARILDYVQRLFCAAGIPSMPNLPPPVFTPPQPLLPLHFNQNDGVQQPESDGI